MLVMTSWPTLLNVLCEDLRILVGAEFELLIATGLRAQLENPRRFIVAGHAGRCCWLGRLKGHGSSGVGESDARQDVLGPPIPRDPGLEGLGSSQGTPRGGIHLS